LSNFAQLLERDRLDLMGLFFAAASLAISDFDAERALCLRVGFALDFGLAAGTVGVAAEATAALDFRPWPSALAIVERCSE
jgi:hypothetical protein